MREVPDAGDHTRAGAPGDASDAVDVDVRLRRLQRRASADGRSRHAVLDASRRALVHYVPPVTRLVIFGAGDDARPVCTLAKSLGWHVAVVDRRARLATTPRFPDADDVVAAEWTAAVRRVQFTPRTAAVLMTHSVPDDVELLPLLADKPLAYVGALGPAHRRGWLLEGAADAGLLPASFTDRLRGPIGLDLGDRTPAGIALDVVAEIAAVLNARDAAPLSHTSHEPGRP